jgi:hypothetical protein
MFIAGLSRPEQNCLLMLPECPSDLTWAACTRFVLSVHVSIVIFSVLSFVYFQPSHKSSVNPVAGAGDWISQLSYRPPLIHTQRDAASYPSGSVSSRPALNIPSQAQPALRHASLERLATFRTRNLLESHALRTGRTRADLEREVSRQVLCLFRLFNLKCVLITDSISISQPYAPREADPAVSTARLRASMRPATAAPSYGSSSSTTGAVLGPDQSLLQVERDVASMSGAQQREQAAAARFQAQTRSLVAEWDAEMARFEEETARFALYLYHCIMAAAESFDVALYVQQDRVLDDFQVSPPRIGCLC